MSKDNDITNSSPSTQWKELPFKLEEKRGDHGAVVLPNNRVLITGGFNGRFSYFDSTEMVDINNNTTSTSTIPNLSTKRSSHASVYLNNTVYVLGGWDGIFRFKTVERIDSNNPEIGWQKVAEMKQKRLACAAAVHDNIIYAIGGEGGSGSNTLATVEVLDTTKLEDGWKILYNQMATPRYDHSMVAIGGKIYIIGGRNNKVKELDSVEIFDTSTQSFRGGPSLPTPIERASAIAVGNLVILIGGFTNGEKSGGSYVLDTTASNPKWKRLDVRLRSPRQGHTIAFLKNKLYVFGGYGHELDTIESISIMDFLPHELMGQVITSSAENAQTQ